MNEIDNNSDCQAKVLKKCFALEFDELMQDFSRLVNGYQRWHNYSTEKWSKEKPIGEMMIDSFAETWLFIWCIIRRIVRLISCIYRKNTMITQQLG